MAKKVKVKINGRNLALGLAGVVMPNFAAVFLVPTALVCGMIAFKRGQRGLGGAGVVLAIIGLLSIIYVSQQINRVDGFDFNLTMSGNATMGPGGTTTLYITAAKSVLFPAPSRNVTFSISGLPDGAAAGFNPPSCMVTCSTILTISLPAGATTGDYPIVITAVSDGDPAVESH